MHVSEGKQPLPETSGGRTFTSLQEKGGRKDEEGLARPLLLEEERDGESKEGSLGGATGITPLLDFFCPAMQVDGT